MNYNGARVDFVDVFAPPPKPYTPVDYSDLFSVKHKGKDEKIVVGDTVGYKDLNRKGRYGTVIKIFAGKAVVEIFGRGTHIAYINELTKYAVG
ncbi:MAG TPA: hypothetical protein DDW54_04375 [Clostridiales bacterium]|nr:hypothetical protein [Clostridiales bacterium]